MTNTTTNTNKFITKNKRIKRFLYILGFEFTAQTQDNKESYIFEETKKLKESVEFYYKIRKTFQNEQE